MSVVVVEGSFFSIVKRVFPYTSLCLRGCVSTWPALKLYSTTAIHAHSSSLKQKAFVVPCSVYKAHTQPLHPEKAKALNEIFLLHLWTLR